MKDKVNNTTQKDPRIYVSYSNSLDFNPKKVRDYSEYIALIEVSDDKDIEGEETSETAIQAIDFVVIGELDLSELISLIDQVTFERDPYSEIRKNGESTKTKDLRKQSMEKDLNFGMLLVNEQYDLSEIMLQLDETIDMRR